jgi:hypothetical protein
MMNQMARSFQATASMNFHQYEWRISIDYAMSWKFSPQLQISDSAATASDRASEVRRRHYAGILRRNLEPGTFF